LQQEIISTITIGFHSLEWHCTRPDRTLHVVENRMKKKEFDPMMEEVNEGWRTRSNELHYLHAPTVI
jgi:hypothetical protein